MNITLPRAVIEQALEALENVQGLCTDANDGWVEAVTIWTPEAITALRTALEQPEQEPVAYIHETGFLVRNPGANLTVGTKLYAAPTSRKPLTEEEIAYAVREISFPSITAIARAVEAAHGIKGDA